MWKARALPSEELSWHVFLPCVEGLTSWSYQQGIKICSVDLMHMRFISPCSCSWRFYSYLSVYRQNRGMMSDLQHEDLVKLGQSPLLSSLFFFVEVGKVVSKQTYLNNSISFPHRHSQVKPSYHQLQMFFILKLA